MSTTPSITTTTQTTPLITNNNNNNISYKNYSIFCLVKTHPENILSKKAFYTFKIWVEKCDNYRFTTLIPKEMIPNNFTNSSVTTEIFNQFYMIQPKRFEYENHNNLTHKVYYSIRYVYSKFPNYDWYYIVDDDSYVNINNFKKFLSDKNSKEPITYGFNFHSYHSGGPGYILSHEAFTRLGKTLTESVNKCPDTGIDDIDVNACLHNLGVQMGISVDQQNRQRFLIFNLTTHFSDLFQVGLLVTVLIL